MLIDLSGEYSSYNLLYSYFKRELSQICINLTSDEIKEMAKKFAYKYDTLLTDEMERQFEKSYEKE